VIDSGHNTELGMGEAGDESVGRSDEISFSEYQQDGAAHPAQGCLVQDRSTPAHYRRQRRPIVSGLGGHSIEHAHTDVLRRRTVFEHLGKCVTLSFVEHVVANAHEHKATETFRLTRGQCQENPGSQRKADGVHMRSVPEGVEDRFFQVLIGR